MLWGILAVSNVLSWGLPRPYRKVHWPVGPHESHHDSFFSHNIDQLLMCYGSGGEEVLLDVAGQDGSEAFEDVGHSDEAREILDGLFVGNVKRMVQYFSPLSLPLSLSS